jgi:hypothetical protein
MLVCRSFFAYSLRPDHATRRGSGGEGRNAICPYWLAEGARSARCGGSLLLACGHAEGPAVAGSAKAPSADAVVTHA